MDSRHHLRHPRYAGIESTRRRNRAPGTRSGVAVFRIPCECDAPLNTLRRSCDFTSKIGRGLIAAWLARFPIVLHRDFPEPIAANGASAPAASNSALKTRTDALQADWPLDNAHVSDAATADAEATPKQAHATPLEMAKSFGELATGPGVAPYRRAPAAGILESPCASLRFADDQMIRTFEIDDDSAR